MPKIFFGAFFWEAFGLACLNHNTCSTDKGASFAFITGFGDAFGVFIGHSLILYWLKNTPNFSIKYEFYRTCFLGLCVFFGVGTMWQFNVDTGHHMGARFTGSFFYMIFIAFIVYFTSTLFFRYLNDKILINYYNLVTGIPTIKPYIIWNDIQLSLSVAVGQAFFMGTSAVEFTDNWLAPAFGVYNNTSYGTAIFLAGISTSIGFLIAQIIQNIVIKYSYLDPNDGLSPENLLDNIIKQNSRSNDEV
eukprot:gene14834-19933_t